MEEITKSIENEIRLYLAPDYNLVEDAAVELSELAYNYHKNGENDKAISFLKEALEICNKNDLLSTGTHIGIRLGEFLLDMDKTKQSIKQLENIRRNCYCRGNIDYSIRILHSLAKCHKKLGDNEKAVQYYSKCISEILSEWSKLKDIQLMSSYLNDKMDSFLEIVSILSDENKIEKAYEYVRLSKANSIIEFRGKVPKSITTHISNKLDLRISEIKKELSEIHEKIYSLNKKIQSMRSKNLINTDFVRENLKQEKEIIKEIGAYKAIARKIEREEDRLLRQIRENIFEKSLKQIKNREFQLSDVKHLLSSSPIIDFFFTQNSLLLFLITKHGLFRKKVNISHLDFIKKIKLTGFIQIREDYTDDEEEKWIIIDKLGKLLNQTFIKPLTEYIEFKNFKTICLIPHGILHHLPLHIAYETDNGNIRNCLLKSKAVFYQPNIAFFTENAPSIKYEDRSLLAIANPEKENTELYISKTEEEVELISKYFDSYNILKNEEANFENVINKSKNFDIIHFACHGYVRTDIPEFSYIRLFEGKKLRFVDIISKMHLKAELVVLSACNTAINILQPSDEMMALSRAFIHAGARTIIASLWKVEDDFAKQIMNRFYNLWTLKGLSKAEALRVAQIELLEETNWEHIYYYMPFVLIGAPE